MPKPKPTPKPRAKKALGYTPPESTPLPTSEDQIFSAHQIKTMEFDMLKFDGEWKKLFGQPDPNFTMMIFAKPKQGKSTIMIDFANYLATYFGNVLYVAIEETIRRTLQEKIIRLGADHPRLDFTGKLPNTIPDKYQFVFIDSANAAGIDIDRMRSIIKKNPSKGIVFVFQTTKEGNFRGGQELEHEVGMVCEIKDGIGYVRGRYAQGTSLNVAEEYNLR